jgi:hypothetical protein
MVITVIVCKRGIDLKHPEVQIIDFDKPDTLTNSGDCAIGTTIKREGGFEVDYEYPKQFASAE